MPCLGLGAGVEIGPPTSLAPINVQLRAQAAPSSWRPRGAGHAAHTSGHLLLINSQI